MDRVGDAISRHRIVGLDTSAFIYHLEGTSQFADTTGVVLGQIQNGVLSGVTSILTLMELTVKPLQMKRPEVAAEYETLLSNFPNLTLIDIDSAVAVRAAEIRATYGLHAPDAIHLAACLHAGATAFITNDAALRRVLGLEIILLSDFVHDS